MNSLIGLKRNYLDENESYSKNGSEPLSQVAAVFAQNFWNFDVTLDDLVIKIQTAKPDAFQSLEDIACLRLSMGDDWLDVATPIALVDALLSRAPDPETISQLSAEDAALVLEHVLTPALELLEKNVGMPVRIHTIERSTANSYEDWQAKLRCQSQGKTFPTAMRFESPAIAKALIAQIEALEALGPSIKVGFPLQIGPVFLSEEEIASLAAGDELLLGVPSFEGLSGLVEYDDNLCWPIKLVEGKIEFSGTLTPYEPFKRKEGDGLPLFYQLGAVAEERGVIVGMKVALARIEDKRMMIRHGKRDIARAKMVKLADGVALRITELAGA